MLLIYLGNIINELYMDISKFSKNNKLGILTITLCIDEINDIRKDFLDELTIYIIYIFFIINYILIYIVIIMETAHLLYTICV